jgi:hypothetical protein
MKIKGIDYDLGVVYAEGISSRPTFDQAIVKREIEIIKNDLHCNAIRLNGHDIQRLTFAGECALDQGLQVWFLPKYVDATEQATLPYLAECARTAEKLRQRSPDVVFIVGCEFTMFLNGILEGANILERLGNPSNWERIRRGEHNRPLNDFLAKVVAEIRQYFHGPLTYASLPIEKVDWELFDIVGLDHYREARNRHTYRETLERYFTSGKPVVITEFGSCAYRGAEDKGARGWEVVDIKANPPQIIGDFVRDEAVQANELVDLLQILDAANVAGAFVYTFAAPTNTYNENPKYDLDMANYGLVTSYADKLGTIYPDMPWDPKEAFYAVADYYTNH